MDAIIISIKGDLKPIALRHHVFEMGKSLGISGFLNYREGMFELLIRAEGESNVMIEFTNQINQLARQHKLVYSIKSVIFQDYLGFKISPIDINLNQNFEDSNTSLNTDSINFSYAQIQDAEQQQNTNNKNQPSDYKKIFSFFKQAGLW